MFEQYKTKEHPAKAILMRDYKLPLSVIANFIGISYSYTCNVLSGTYPTKKHNEKLNELIELCKQERANA